MKQFLRQTLTKRFFILFSVFFFLWYSLSFYLNASFEATLNPILLFGLQMIYPVLIFFFSGFYFLKSRNDWNDRMMVALGWNGIAYLFSAILANPLYGISWSDVLSLESIYQGWPGVFSVILVGLLLKNDRLSKHLT